MKIKITGISNTFNSLKKSLEKETQKGFEKEVRKFKSELRFATPVDTGEARDSWQVFFNKGKATVVSDAEHMPRLNEGYSKQAPSNFIERVAIRFGKPVGLIVRINEP